MFSKVYNTIIFASLLVVVVLLLASCSTIEVLPGLCYNDRDGTYLCPVKEPPVIEEIVVKENACEIWRNVDDPDAYMNCISL